MSESEHDAVSTGTTPTSGGETAERPTWARRVRAVVVATALGAVLPWTGLAVSYNDGVQFVILFGFLLILLLPVSLAVAYGLWRLGRWLLREVGVPRPAAVSGLAIAALVGVILQAESDMTLESYASVHGAGWILAASEVWLWRCGAMSLAGAVACGLVASLAHRPRWAPWAAVGILVGAFLALELARPALEGYQARYRVQQELDSYEGDFAVVDGGGWEPAWIDEFGTLAYSNEAGQEAHLEFSSMDLREDCGRVACEQHGDVLVVPNEDGDGEEVRVPLEGEKTVLVASEADAREVGQHVRQGTAQDRAELAESLEGNSLLRP